MLRKRISRKARNDLEEIRRFTRREWGEKQSVFYVREIYRKVDLLAAMPRIGIDRSLELGEGIHSCLSGSHVVYYSYDSSELTIRTILHQSRLPKRHLTGNE